MEKTLMHTCCAPCSVSCIQQLRSEGIEPVAYWYNPNIHPYQEYKARRDTLMAYAPTIGMELIVQENYGLREFCRAVCGDIDHRCSVCYALRLAQAAQYAARHGYDSFTTTLLVSPYQNHELLAETAERMGREYGVRFLYRDFRPGFRQEISTVSSAKAAETTKIQGLTEVIGIIPLSRATITGVSCPPISQPITSPMGIPTAERVRACRRMIRRSCRGVVPMVFRRP